MAKSLRDITKHGVNASKEVPNDLTNLAMSPEGNKGEIEFAKKHKISRKEDPAGNGDEIFKASKIKAAPYNKQDAKVYESAECNHSGKGVHCEMHGDEDCSSASDKEPRYKGKKLLTDKKKDVAEASQYRSTYGMGKRGWASKNAGKITFQGAANYNKTGESKSKNREEAEKLSAGKQITKLPPGKAKGLKEEEINEVAPPNPKIEAWIKANKERFVKEYGEKKGKEVLYAKAWKMHGQSESGPATETDYASPGAAGWSTGRQDVGTL